MGDRGDYRRGDTVNARVARVKYWRDVAEGSRKNNGGVSPAVIERITVDWRHCIDQGNARVHWETKRPRRRTPPSARAYVDSEPRSGVSYGQHGPENHTRADRDFHFHDVVAIDYIYAHNHLSCNTDCADLAGMLAAFSGREFEMFASPILL